MRYGEPALTRPTIKEWAAGLTLGILIGAAVLPSGSAEPTRFYALESGAGD